MICHKYLTYIFFHIYIFSIEAYLIGEPCTYDDDCFVDHSYCEMQQICQCKENFIETESRETCIALVGAHCHSKYDCSSLANSFCKDDRCECTDGFVPDAQGMLCMPVAKHIEGPCDHKDQCQVSFGDFSACKQNRCVCLENYHFSGKCIESRALGMKCDNSSQCYIGEDNRNTVECKYGKCSCRGNYYQKGTICISGGNSFHVSNVLLFVCFITLAINNMKHRLNK